LSQNCDKQYFSIQHIHDPCRPNQQIVAILGYKFWDRNHPYSMLAIIYDKEEQTGSGENGLNVTINWQ